jgi:myo-inositol-1-phosphate synthase
VDTYKSGVAEKALEYGVAFINDPSNLTIDPKLANVVDLAKHMVAETKRIGATHFVHDALTLLVCKATQTVLEETDLLRHWVLPTSFSPSSLARS